MNSNSAEGHVVGLESCQHPLIPSRHTCKSSRERRFPAPPSLRLLEGSRAPAAVRPHPSLSRSSSPSVSSHAYFCCCLQPPPPVSDVGCCLHRVQSTQALQAVEPRGTCLCSPHGAC